MNFISTCKSSKQRRAHHKTFMALWPCSYKQNLLTLYNNKIAIEQNTYISIPVISIYGYNGILYTSPAALLLDKYRIRKGIRVNYAHEGKVVIQYID